MNLRTARHARALTCLVLSLALGWAAPSSSLEADGKGKKAQAKEAAAEKPLPNTWYARTRVSTKFGPVINHYWSKQTWLRSETLLAGHRVVTVVDSSHYYVYDLVMGEGLAVARGASAIADDEGRGRPFARELDALLEDGGELIHEGTSEATGVPYRVYQLTNENGRRRITVTDSEPILPISIETYVRSAGHNGFLEYSGWQRGLEIADSFFVPPAHIRWERLSYDEYVEKAQTESVGPAPIYFRHLLHGR